MLVGRKQEIHFLDKNYQKNGSQLLALYGKRRTGKTELLKSFCQGKNHSFYVCRETTDGEQIRLFSNKILEHDPLQPYIGTFPDWESAFGFLLEKKQEKSIIIIDEFPYMVQNNPAIPSILQSVWDSKHQDGNTMLVLTGSAMGYMEKEILGGNKPLFGRTDGILVMDELNFIDAVSLLRMDAPMAIESVCILGGVPRYLQQFSPNLNIEENIKEHILNKGCSLYSEIDYLMKQDLREAATYYTILEALAKGFHKIGDISRKTELDRTKINVYLKILQDLRVVQREQPVTSTKGTNKSHNSRYRISNHYFRFFFRFMYPHHSWLEEGETDRLYTEIIHPQLADFYRESLMTAAKENLISANKKGELPFSLMVLGPYWDKETELDLLGLGIHDELLSVAIISRPDGAGLDDLQQLRERTALLKRHADKQVFCLFSLHGFHDNLTKMSLLDSSILLKKFL